MPRREIEGIVVSDKMDKTRIVAVHESLPHPKYGKYIQKTIKFAAHDEKNETHLGDKVLMIESRPLSRRKRWAIESVIQKAEQA